MGPKMRAKPAKKRRRLAPEARREEILEAAVKVFVRGGYHGTHVSHVIQEAGVARGTFYLYFESKHAVFEALVDRMLSIFLDARSETPDPEVRTLVDAEALLRISYRAVFETFRRHRQLCRLLFDEAVGADKGFADRLAKHYLAWHGRIAATLRLFVERGVARKGLDAEVSAELILGAVERATRRYVLPDKAPDLERLIDAIVALELRGTRA